MILDYGDTRVDNIGQNNNRCPTRGPIIFFFNHLTRHWMVKLKKRSDNDRERRK